MKVSVLETGKLPENLEKKFGDYPKMFSDLFDELNVHYEMKSFDLINNEFPKNMANTDLWLITGSSFGVYEKIGWIDKLKNLVQKIYNMKINDWDIILKRNENLLIKYDEQNKIFDNELKKYL